MRVIAVWVPIEAMAISLPHPLSGEVPAIVTEIIPTPGSDTTDAVVVARTEGGKVLYTEITQGGLAIAYDPTSLEELEAALAQAREESVPIEDDEGDEEPEPGKEPS